MAYYNDDGTTMTPVQQAAGNPMTVFDLGNQYLRAQAIAPVNQQEAEDISNANKEQSGRLNTAALAGSRRRAGGTTFRRKGSAVSANQLVSGLGTASAKALAQQRRANAVQSVGAGMGGQATAPMQAIRIY